MRIRIETLEKDCNIKPFQAFSYTTLNGICYSRERCKNDVILSMDYSETELETVEQELFAQA